MRDIWRVTLNFTTSRVICENLGMEYGSCHADGTQGCRTFVRNFIAKLVHIIVLRLVEKKYCSLSYANFVRVEIDDLMFLSRKCIYIKSVLSLRRSWRQISFIVKS